VETIELVVKFAMGLQIEPGGKIDQEFLLGPLAVKTVLIIDQEFLLE
tara:strand:+ start:105 stop:245 length:141 start_codon:yes stop_codon:yes gene_type:complete